MPKRHLIEAIASQSGLNANSVAAYIYMYKWPTDLDGFMACFNSRKAKMETDRANRRILAKQKAAATARARYRALTSEERIQESRKKRASAKARGMEWLNRRGDRHKPETVLAHRYRQRLRNMVGGNYWGKRRPKEFLGCTLSFLRQYIEARFKPGMTWENRGEWELDHIEACKTFDLTKEREVLRCFHFTNLRPEWMGRNRSRGCKPDETQLDLITV